MKRTLLIVLAIAIATPSFAAAQALVPADTQALIFARVLAYDRALKARAGNDVRIALVVRSMTDAASREVADAFMTLETKTVQGLPVKVLLHDYVDDAELGSWLTKEKIEVVYVMPSLDGKLAGVVAAAKQRKVVVLSPVRKNVEEGAMVSVFLKDNKPHIAINLPSAKAAGMDLDPKLLQLSDIIR